MRAEEKRVSMTGVTAMLEKMVHFDRACLPRKKFSPAWPMKPAAPLVPSLPART